MSNFQTELISSVTIRNSAELSSNAILQFINTLDITYLISAIEDCRDMESSVAISFMQDLISNALIRNLGSFELDSIVHVSHFMDLLSQAYRPYSVDLNSYISITELTLMDIVYKLIQAPVNTLTCNVIQDAYIRESRPTLNYGTSPFLLLGNPLEGHYEFVLQLDTAPYNNLINSLVISAEIVLHLSSTFDNSLIIDMYDISDTWYESTVTWANFHPDVSKPLASFVCNSDTIRISILDYINQLKLSSRNSFSLVFKVSSSNEFLFYIDSRDSTTIQNRPHIEVRYQDNSWTGFTANTDLNTIASIRTTNARDLLSTLTIRRTELISLDSKAIVQYTKNPEIPSTTIVRQLGVNDIPSIGNAIPNTNISSNVIVRHTEFTDIPSNVRTFIANDLTSSADVKTFFTWLPGKGIVRRTNLVDLESSVVIRRNEDLISDSIIQRGNYKDLSSNVKTRKTANSDIASTIVIRQLLDLPSTSISRRSSSKDLGAIASVRYSTDFDLNSQIQVRGSFNDLVSLGMIRKSAKTDLNSYAYTAYGTLLDSMVTVKSLIISGYNELSSKVVVRAPGSKDLDSTINVHKFSDLVSSLQVRKSNFSNLSSSVSIRKSDYVDIGSSLTVRSILDLLGSSIIRNTSIKDLNSLAQLIPNLDLISKAIILQSKDMASIGIIRQHSRNDLDSQVILRQFDINELASSIYVLGGEYTDMSCVINIQTTGMDYLEGVSVIQTNARHWVPNIQGNDIFNYENRKLPRVWKRELFIP